MYKLNFFVPSEDKERVKEALFAIGVGRYENYECCSFETLGSGQFKPINKAHPHIGELDKIEHVSEYKVEMICEETLIKKAIEILNETHPYEEVAYEVFRIEEI
ncbi:MAG: NGG1p interacting factor NIF3 [Sulfurimonas sp. RIFCSPHIGHO2_12_FULL_36_9]|uniref:NGG1p interacting factor NIF3 n=1 Tax=Sulfurimonas sp. RIFCSPLOWO2_12_36_12 TaxID=1802253 RepID=UPI0008CF0652|nr:NGG1p interacting factor NIF3 [Sulfurimonas sp. RIFCSPLOWO2_12_36_12]OHD97841.1 MAG: NGG1p interacting factor NIF3 [Sulfurimonas sp. RIFCSPLOWO2_02_FULL_36_28]OHD98705.1 MAG: NGG1p interacting factor NIF3 [Sulfurimonas sp. RIFCSPHIGHO2_12_FULL_36_9]OHE02514.1 MAG: NGG1p interacting factor NIF3 [Sulfurimonas sp. RIFCSPLOWO2_12_36_12]OHE07907.1 MAG: NGG1p interacting factor NIF3 [Sulfurimonas sp. RIFCSPLOWO2_12_FULL_36_74]